MRKLFLIMILVMSISGCNTDSGVSEVLNVAEDRMDAAPDSVLRLIDTLDID